MTYDARKLLYESGGSFPQTQISDYDEATNSFNTVRVDQFGHFHQDSYVWDSGSLQWIPAEPGGGGATVVGLKNVGGTQINPATEESLQSLVGFEIPPHDYISLGYTGTDLTSVTYKTGGSSGTTVATLTLGYSGGNLASVTRS